MITLLSTLAAAIPAVFAAYKAEESARESKKLNADLRNGTMKKVVRDAMKDDNDDS